MAGSGKLGESWSGVKEDGMAGWHRRWPRALVIAGLALATAGCAVRFSKRSLWDLQQIQALSEQLEQFRSLAQLKSDEADQLRAARELLERRLASEINSKDVSVGFDERGLVVRVLDRVIFDSGKAKVRKAAYPVLDKVARVLNQDLPNQPVGVEGHTDNVPIKHSGWESNKALSVARAEAVANYLIEKGVDKDRITVTGHGEDRPIESNDTKDGRQKNRRVEIIILPQSSGYQADAKAAGGYTK